jgi:hypothetical protein
MRGVVKLDRRGSEMMGAGPQASFHVSVFTTFAVHCSNLSGG